MNCTAAYVLVCTVSLAGIAGAQAPSPSTQRDAQASAVIEVVDSMTKAERALKSLRMTMKTSGTLPGGLRVSTSGELRVLRGAQPDAAVRRFSRLEYSFGEGVRGRLESAETADGIRIFEEDPAFGAVFLRLAPSVVRDLEWAGGVLERSDLPGMVDPRARAPLGSGLLLDMMRTFDLKVDDRKERAGVPGVWIVGARKDGLDEQDPDLPLADGVEVFVRAEDHALMVARYLVGADVSQEIQVERLEVDVALSDDDFVVEAHGVQIRSVQDHAPMWEQVEQVIERAEDKAKDGVVRPSRRKGGVGEKQGGTGGK